jgi:hypothetical protein
MNQAMSIMCLYIPNTFGADADYIKFIFERDYCKIDNIELLNKFNYNGSSYTSARVYIQQWYFNIVSANFIQRLLDNKYARIIYDNTNEYYWNVMPNKSSNIRQERLNLDAICKPNLDFTEEQPKRENIMLSNSDFAAMYKSSDIKDEFEDIEFKNACRQLIMDDDESTKSASLASNDYVAKLEEIIAVQNLKIDELTRELTKIKKML